MRASLKPERGERERLYSLIRGGGGGGGSIIKAFGGKGEGVIKA